MKMKNPLNNRQKRILSFGGGLQTTALAIMVAKGELEVDEVIFADTGAEKPETYWYMENYTKPMLEEVGIPEESRWAGATLAEIRIPQQAQLLVIGMRKAAAPGRFVFNPSGGEAVSPGDALIVLGTHEQKAKLESLLSEA